VDLLPTTIVGSTPNHRFAGRDRAARKCGCAAGKGVDDPRCELSRELPHRYPIACTEKPARVAHTSMKKRRIGVVLAAVTAAYVLLSGNGPANAQGEIALGAVLDGLIDKVQQIIDDGKNAGIALEIEGGRQALLAIGAAKAAYQDSMRMTLEQLDAKVRANIDQLASQVNAIQAGGNVTLAQVTSRLQTIVSLMPLRTHEPKVGSIVPSFIATPTGGQDVTVRVTGSFELAGTAGFAPTLVVGARNIMATMSTSQELTFVVPWSNFRSLVDNYKVTFVGGQLIIPWADAPGSRRQDTYPLMLGLLPVSPGTISIVQNFTTRENPTRHYHGPSYHNGSRKEEGNDDHKDVHRADNADSGCAINRDTVRQIGSGSGDQGYGLVSVDEHVVVSTSTTIHHRAGSSGVNDYWIEFDETCPVDVAKTETIVVNSGTQIDLRWSDRRAYAVRDGAAYKVIFDSFDGKHLEYGGPANGYLINVEFQNKQVLISTQAASLLKWP
jgi:hypothetical protein